MRAISTISFFAKKGEEGGNNWGIAAMENGRGGEEVERRTKSWGAKGEGLCEMMYVRQGNVLTIFHSIFFPC